MSKFLAAFCAAFVVLLGTPAYAAANSQHTGMCWADNSVDPPRVYAAVVVYSAAGPASAYVTCTVRLWDASEYAYPFTGAGVVSGSTDIAPARIGQVAQVCTTVDYADDTPTDTTCNPQTVPARGAGSFFTGACDGQAVVLGSNQYTGVIVVAGVLGSTVLSDLPVYAVVHCDVYVNGVIQSHEEFASVGVVAGVRPISFHATAADTVTYCSWVDFTSDNTPNDPLLCSVIRESRERRPPPTA